MNASAEGAQMSGYLHKRSPKSGKYKKMWFVLKDRVLYEYRAPEDTAANETFPVLGFDLDLEYEVRTVNLDLRNCLSAFFRTMRIDLYFPGPKRHLQFARVRRPRLPPDPHRQPPAGLLLGD